MKATIKDYLSAEQTRLMKKKKEEVKIPVAAAIAGASLLHIYTTRRGRRKNITLWERVKAWKYVGQLITAIKSIKIRL